ncbi:MAG: hypothetical protein WA192_01590 [Candidatus Acidiferrales bacterium]
MNRPLRFTPFLAAALAIALGSIGCGHSASEGEEEPNAGLSGADQEAQTAALAELHKHFLKGPDGWTTQVVSGSPYASDRFLRQYRELIVEEVKPQDLTESDKLNGFEWVGRVTFRSTSCREAGGQGGMVLDGMSNAVVSRRPGQWSQWVTFTPGPLPLQKIKGRWQFQWDATWLRGALPGPQDFAAAGVR